MDQSSWEKGRMSGSLVEVSLAECGGEGQDASQVVEDEDPVGLKDLGVEESRESVEPEVRIGADGEEGRILPGLKPGAVDEEMSWFPVVESLVAVGDVAPDGRAEPGREESLERRGGHRRPGTHESPEAVAIPLLPTDRREEC